VTVIDVGAPRIGLLSALDLVGVVMLPSITGRLSGPQVTLSTPAERTLLRQCFRR
jgi:hypothetical protein